MLSALICLHFVKLHRSDGRATMAIETLEQSLKDLLTLPRGKQPSFLEIGTKIESEREMNGFADKVNQGQF